MVNQANTQQSRLCFELPITERLRHFLRVEYLFNRFTSALESEDVFAHHFALSTLFDIMDCASRTELKLDLLTELEKQKTLSKDASDAADFSTSEIQDVLEQLQNVHRKFGQNLRDNEWLMTIKQRMRVAGGIPPFDYYSYFLWQNLSAEERRNDLLCWAESANPTFNAVTLLLHVLRQKGHWEKQKTQNGVYQQCQVGKHVQMLQIELETSVDSHIMPEISANRHLMNIRFVRSDFKLARGTSIKEDINFDLKLSGF